MDVIFGTLVNDALRAVDHRAHRAGVQHNHQRAPYDALPGQPVTVHLTTGPDVIVDAAALYFTTDGATPVGSRGHADHGHAVAFHPAGVTWDNFAWGYVQRWAATIPPQPDGTRVRYIISAWSTQGQEVYADWPDVRDRVETAARQYFAPEGVTVPDAVPGDPAQPTEFAFHVDTLTVPDWARRAVIYHIFVDRFYPGDGRDWTGETDLDGFLGGTLWGVRDKLDYIRDLGVDCIWLSPIFASPTAHGYDTTDYRAVEPRLGGEAALRAVVEDAHERGLRVLLDMACNHLSDRHPIFVQALADPSSPYRDWFFFGQAPLGYRGYFDVATMPEVNLNHPPAREWMIENGLYWLREFAIDGYRLDYASGPGPGFWADFGAAIKRQNPEALLFGEIVDAPDRLLRYEGALDGCLDFAVCDSLRRTYGWRTWTPAQQAAFLDAHNRFFPPETIRPTFLDNHDMDRFLFIAGGDKDALRAAARAQMAIAAPAIVYYGTEVGLSQAVSTREIGLKACREPMPWGEAQDADLLAFYRDLIRARRGAG